MGGGSSSTVGVGAALTGAVLVSPHATASDNERTNDPNTVQRDENPITTNYYGAAGKGAGSDLGVFAWKRSITLLLLGMKYTYSPSKTAPQ